jgi:Na+/melibiose symporter-like transporter
MSAIGASIGAVYLIPPAMLPDVIDEATLRDNGVRREAMFYAYFVFCQKFGSGFAVSLATLSLSAFGNYQSGYCPNRQSPKVEATLRMVQGPVCGGMVAISLLFAIFYPLSTEKAIYNKNKLARLRESKRASAIPTHLVKPDVQAHDSRLLSSNFDTANGNRLLGGTTF